MFIVYVHNDGLGSDVSASYDVEVRINRNPLWRGKVNGHNRKDGWPALLKTIGIIAEQSGAAKGESV